MDIGHHLGRMLNTDLTYEERTESIGELGSVMGDMNASEQEQAIAALLEIATESNHVGRVAVEVLDVLYPNYPEFRDRIKTLMRGLSVGEKDPRSAALEEFFDRTLAWFEKQERMEARMKSFEDLPARARSMIEEFICPGCVGAPKGCYEPLDGGNAYGYGCKRHVLGTLAFPVGNFALGLPKGFNRPGPNDRRDKTRNTMLIRLWPAEGKSPEWDHLNVAVWAMEKDGFLFVRTYMPRINDAAVDVIEGGTMELVPNAIDVGEFIEEID